MLAVINKTGFDMKQITIKIKDSYYSLFVQFLRSLTYVEIEKIDVLSVQSLEQQSDERQKMIDYIHLIKMINLLLAKRLIGKTVKDKE